MKTWKILSIAGAVFFGVIAVIVLVAVFVLGNAAKGLFDTGARDTAKEFIQLLDDGEYAAAYALTSDEFQADTSLATLEEVIESDLLFEEGATVAFTYRGVETEAGETVHYLSGTISSESYSSPITVKMRNAGTKDEPDWEIILLSFLEEDVPSGALNDDSSSIFDEDEF